MINEYEARLGTERMLPLVFKMALPAVAAQFINLLYSMVDRIYIGHISGIGTDALAIPQICLTLKLYPDCPSIQNKKFPLLPVKPRLHG